MKKIAGSKNYSIIKTAEAYMTIDRWLTDRGHTSPTGHRQSMDTANIEDWKRYSNLLLDGLQEATRQYNDILRAYNDYTDAIAAERARDEGYNMDRAVE